MLQYQNKMLEKVKEQELSMQNKSNISNLQERVPQLNQSGHPRKA